MRGSLGVLIAGYLVSVLAAATVSAAERPNVIVIMTDDQGTADLGAAGATDIETPHLDALGQAGCSIQSVLRRGAGLLAVASRAAHRPPSFSRRHAVERLGGCRCSPACRRGKSRSPRCSRQRATPPVTSASGTSASAAKRCRWGRASTFRSATWGAASTIIRISFTGADRTGTTSFATVARCSFRADSSAI